MAMIPAETLEQIAAATDIVDLIGSYFPLRRAGSTYKALCPFHQEKSPSFTVNPQRQIFKCFGCGAGGAVFKFVELYEHLSFPDAVRKLAARAGIPIIEDRSASSEDDDRKHEARRNLLRLHAEASEWFHQNLRKREFASSARDYLKKRGVEAAVANSWQLGYAPESWDAFLKWGLAQGYRRGLLLQSGLIKLRDEERTDGEVYDRFRGRLMFPICNDVGEVIAFSGRVLQSDTQAAKYLNSPETPLFRKGSVLFGLHKTKRGLIDAGSAIVCEGQLDLITVFEAGMTNVVAPQGTAFTANQARILKRFVHEVVLCFDADTAGRKAAERSLEALLQNDLVMRVAEMPPGEDPDSMIRKHGAEAFNERIKNAREFFDYWIDRESSETDLSSIGAKMQLARRLAESVARVHDPMMRGQVISRVTARLGVGARDFESLLPKPAREATEQAAANPGVMAPAHDISLLCLLALRDAAVREFVLAQRWQAVLEETPGAELLAEILAAEIEPDETASMNAFVASLPEQKQALVSAWLLQKLPPNAEKVAADWWNGLRLGAVRRKLRSAESRIRLPQITADEVLTLQKQIVDLQGQLTDISTFSPARVLDP